MYLQDAADGSSMISRYLTQLDLTNHELEHAHSIDINQTGQVMSRDTAPTSGIVRFAVATLPPVYAVFFSTEQAARAKQFWQHTGTGISSRAAETYLQCLRGEVACIPDSADANEAIKQRLAVAYGVASQSDVFLFSCGMHAIYAAVLLLAHLHRQAGEPQFIQFGFPYTDTLKILQRFSFDCQFYGYGHAADMDVLEQRLKDGTHSVAGLFTEFPSNPLLHSPDLKRLKALSTTYGFPVVVDDTIGNFDTVNVLPSCDIVVSSLTKIFSGSCDVMGGRLVLRHPT
jgi:cystathionine gamma-synthase